MDSMQNEQDVISDHETGPADGRRYVCLFQSLMMDNQCVMLNPFTGNMIFERNGLLLPNCSSLILLSFPSVQGLTGSINKAVTYLQGRLPHLTYSYAVAMTSYALANENKLNRGILDRFDSTGVVTS